MMFSAQYRLFFFWDCRDPLLTPCWWYKDLTTPAPVCLLFLPRSVSFSATQCRPPWILVVAALHPMTSFAVLVLFQCSLLPEPLTWFPSRWVERVHGQTSTRTVWIWWSHCYWFDRRTEWTWCAHCWRPKCYNCPKCNRVLNAISLQCNHRTPSVHCCYSGHPYWDVEVTAIAPKNPQTNIHVTLRARWCQLASFYLLSVERHWL